jgi:hypothetical protein
MPGADFPNRLMRATLVAAAAVGPLALFANACGNIHQSACGLASLPAVALVVPPLVLASSLAGPESPAWLFWLFFCLFTFVVVTVLAWAFLSGVALFTRRMKQR